MWEGDVISEEIRASICEQLADGKSLREICRQEGMPAASTVFVELSQDAGFAEQYARAKQAGIEAMADEITDIADNARNDWMERNGSDDVGWVANGEHTRRSQLRIDTRKWLLSKLAPKKYGDRIEHDVKGTMSVTLASGDEKL